MALRTFPSNICHSPGIFKLNTMSNKSFFKHQPRVFEDDELSNIAEEDEKIMKRNEKKEQNETEEDFVDVFRRKCIREGIIIIVGENDEDTVSVTRRAAAGIYSRKKGAFQSSIPDVNINESIKKYSIRRSDAPHLKLSKQIDYVTLFRLKDLKLYHGSPVSVSAQELERMIQMARDNNQIIDRKHFTLKRKRGDTVSGEVGASSTTNKKLKVSPSQNSSADEGVTGQQMRTNEDPGSGVNAAAPGPETIRASASTSDCSRPILAQIETQIHMWTKERDTAEGAMRESKEAKRHTKRKYRGLRKAVKAMKRVVR